MTGLEKVTGKIIADAEADARATLAAAQADCEAADAAAAAKTEADCDGLRESAGREGESLIRRAKSAAEMARRDVLLETRSGLVEEAYRQAEKEIRDLPADKYAALLTGMLKAALRRQLEDEQESMRLYGENIAPAAYEILLNARDRKTYGQQLLDAVNAGSFAKIGLTRQDAVKLPNETADITGGLILRCGEVEINCSLRMMFDEVRRRTEGRVSGILFGRDAEPCAGIRRGKAETHEEDQGNRIYVRLRPPADAGEPHGGAGARGGAVRCQNRGGGACPAGRVRHCRRQGNPEQARKPCCRVFCGTRMTRWHPASRTRRCLTGCASPTTATI